MQGGMKEPSECEQSEEVDRVPMCDSRDGGGGPCGQEVVLVT